MALNAAASAYRFALTNPGDPQHVQEQASRTFQYNLGWAIYTNKVFDTPGWAAYASANGLYSKTKGFYNPVSRLVDFNASHLYQGALSADGRNLPDGQLLAIPLASDTDETIREALGQLWQWSNMAEVLDMLVMYGASMGDVFLETVEDVEAGRIWQQAIPGGHIPEFDLDARRNVIYYENEYSYYDRAEQRSKKYKKIVTPESIEIFIDDSRVSNDPNPYGFCPLVYIAHRNMGSIPGAPAVRNWNKIELLCSLLTRLNVHLTVQSKSPTVVAGKGIKFADTSQDATKASEEEIKLLLVQAESATGLSLSGNLDIPGLVQWIEKEISEIEMDHPEVTMYNRLREEGDISGIAVELLMGDVKGIVDRTRKGYDAGLIRSYKHAMTIGGVRYKEGRGGWANRTDQQKKFAPFDLKSFEKGDLDFEIMAPRPLVAKPKLQYWQEETARYQAVEAGVKVGEPLEYQYQKRDGFTDEEIKELHDYQDRDKARPFGDGQIANGLAQFTNAKTQQKQNQQNAASAAGIGASAGREIASQAA